MSLPLKVFAEVIDPVVAFFEPGPCDMAEQDSMHDDLISRRTTWEVNLGDPVTRGRDGREDILQHLDTTVPMVCIGPNNLYRPLQTECYEDFAQPE